MLLLAIRLTQYCMKATRRRRCDFQEGEEYGECQAICRQPGYRQEACLP